MSRSIKNLFGGRSTENPRKSGAATPRHRRPLGIENLEERAMMAANIAAAADFAAATNEFQEVAPAAVSVSMANGDLVIRGTDGDDDVKVSTINGKIVVTAASTVNGKVFTTTSTWQPTGGDVFFYGNKGNDKFTTSMSSGNYLRVTADGGEGFDILYGSWGHDNLKGGNGDDILYGHGGNDFLDGGNGADTIYGQDGDDTIFAGPDYAPNTVYGGNGNDKITGGYGYDLLHGEGGNDEIDGSYGADDIYGGDGDDILRAGNDSLRNYLDGGNGGDTLFGSYGNDVLFGRAGSDKLHGGAGNDKLDGGAGDDVLYGGAGNDNLFGGTGLDFLFGEEGDDSLNGGGDDDVEDSLFGGPGKDTFYWEHSINKWWRADYTPPLAECMDFVSGEDIAV